MNPQRVIGRVAGAFACALLLQLLGGSAHARDCRKLLIPNIGTLISKGLVPSPGCGLCHVSASGGGNRNVFGTDVENAIQGSSSCSADVWTPAIAALDSDGDGFTNGQELQDPGGTWTVQKPQPGNPALVSNPAKANSVPPSPTPSPTPSPSPTVSITQSPSPTPTLTPSPSPFPPTILIQPLNQKVKVGQNASFFVGAAGEGTLTYQWTANMTPLPSQTNPLLPLTNIQPGDAGPYQCFVTNAGGTTPSNAGQLTVLDGSTADNATFQKTSIPATMYVGQSIIAGITMINTSGLTWSAAQGYTLQFVSDPNNFTGGVGSLPIPDLLVVPSGGAAFQFIGPALAPASPGDFSIQVQMGLGGPPTLFGELHVINIHVVPKPNAADEWTRYE